MIIVQQMIIVQPAFLPPHTSFSRNMAPRTGHCRWRMAHVPAASGQSSAQVCGPSSAWATLAAQGSSDCLGEAGGSQTPQSGKPKSTVIWPMGLHTPFLKPPLPPPPCLAPLCSLGPACSSLGPLLFPLRPFACTAPVILTTQIVFI